MADDNTDDFSTVKHEQLTRISAFASAFAWIVLIVQILWAGASFIQTQQTYTLMFVVGNLQMGQPGFFEMLAEDPVYLASLITVMAGTVLRGIIWWLVLKGIAVGLNMVVETDLNYRDRSLEGNHG